MAKYNRYSKDEDDILLEIAKDFNPHEYLDKAAELRLLMQRAVERLPGRDMSGLRKRYLRLCRITVPKKEPVPLPLEVEPPAPEIPARPADYMKPKLIAKMEPTDDGWFIKPPSLDRLMGRR